MILEFKFKGDRTYIHGTDMINKFLQNQKDVSTISVQIRHMTNKNLKIIDQSGEFEGKVVAKISLDGCENRFNLVETNSIPDTRYPYDEESLVADAIIEQKSKVITLIINNSYSLVENIVALQKKLLTDTVSSSVKWLFVGLQLEMIPTINTGDQLKLSVVKELSTKLIVSDIHYNQKSIGHIKFSSINK